MASLDFLPEGWENLPLVAWENPQVLDFGDEIFELMKSCRDEIDGEIEKLDAYAQGDDWTKW